jgi:quaternary ammonium compound-resistance protein SugE
LKAFDPVTQAWGLLVLAGLFEVGFTTAMNWTSKGTWWAEALFLACVIASFGLLEQATRTIPIGIAYAVWTGIGAVGTLLVSSLIFRTPITGAQTGFVLLLIAAVVGLKLTGAKG